MANAWLVELVGALMYGQCTTKGAALYISDEITKLLVPLANTLIFTQVWLTQPM